MKTQNYEEVRESNMSWTDPVQIIGSFGNANVYSFGTPIGHRKPKVFKKVFLKTRIPKQSFIKRVHELESFNHQNYVKVSHRQINNNKPIQDIIKDFAVFSDYVESIPALNLLKMKRQLYLSNFISIVQQMTNLMCSAENKQIFHFHINADSVLFIQGDSGSTKQIFLKICDWGYQNQLYSRKQFSKLSSFLKKMCQNSMFQYLHPQLLFQQNNKKLYKEYKSKYDIWSFGIILYRLAYLKRPFQFNGSFSPEMLQDYYKGKRNLDVVSKTLLGSLIGEMLSLKGFSSWYEVKRFLIKKAERTETDFFPIKELYDKEMRLITYMMEMYKLIAWNVVNSSNSFWYENKIQIKSILVYLLKIILILHSKKFPERYGHRMTLLSVNEKKGYDEIGVIIQKEANRIGFSQESCLESQNFFSLFDKLAQILLHLQLKFVDYSQQKTDVLKSSSGVRIKQSSLSVKTLRSFSSKILNAKSQIKDLNKKIFHFLFQIIENS